MEFDFESLYSETRHEWEPKSALEWTEIDPMSRSLRRVEIEVSTTDQELISFQAAWMRCPPLIRAQILRERELAAALVEFLPTWRKRIPSLLSIGVGNRWPDRGLGAIVTVDQPLTSGEWFDVVNDWSQRRARRSLLPDSSQVKDAEVPIYPELRSRPMLLGQVPADNFLFGDPDPVPTDAPVIQSGDKICSESPSGIRESGTLSCIVSEAGSTEPMVLASAHVLLKANYALLTSRVTNTRVGVVKNVNMDCDAALATLNSPFLCDYRLKVSDLVPAAPVIATNDLPVQLHGAVSGPQTGYLNQVDVIPAHATKVGLFPVFSASINCVRGDSGALLVTGRGKTPPVPESQQKYMSAAYLESMTCAMLGMLMAGPMPGADPMIRPQAYFSPMLRVLNDLRVEAWVR